MRTRVILAVAASVAALAGCAHDPSPPSAEKVKAALERLAVDPDSLYFERFIATSPTTGQVSQQVIIVVPAEGGRSQIVDAQGEVFEDYNDFLRNNTLPDQPGSG